jgi:hypothetical protein
MCGTCFQARQPDSFRGFNWFETFNPPRYAHSETFGHVAYRQVVRHVWCNNVVLASLNAGMIIHESAWKLVRERINRREDLYFVTKGQHSAAGSSCRVPDLLVAKGQFRNTRCCHALINNAAPWSAPWAVSEDLRSLLFVVQIQIVLEVPQTVLHVTGPAHLQAGDRHLVVESNHHVAGCGDGALQP